MLCLSYFIKQNNNNKIKFKLIRKGSLCTEKKLHKQILEKNFRKDLQVDDGGDENDGDGEWHDMHPYGDEGGDEEGDDGDDGGDGVDGRDNGDDDGDGKGDGGGE